jgi:uncharacterized membrane protein YccC
MRECGAGPGHLARFGWREALWAGPAGWKDVVTWRTLRVAAGVLLPLAAGAASGHAQYGAFASLGALPAGLASFQGVTRTRVTAVTVASAGMAVSTFVGGTVAAAASWLLVPVVMVWGYVTGLAVCLGPLASVAVAQWPVALLIAVGLPLGPGDAALRAGFVLAGGLFQGILAMIAWTVRRGDPERAALAASYRSLAAYAAGLAAGRTGPPPPAAFPAATRLADPNPLLPRAVRLAHGRLLEHAERLRVSLAALGAYTAGDPAAARFAADAGRVLALAGRTLTARRADRAGLLRALAGITATLAVPADARWSWAGEAFAGHLEATAEILAGLGPGAVAGLAADDLPGRSARPAPAAGPRWIARTMRASLGPASEAGRHALRLAVTVGLAEALVQSAGLFEGRWAVLTVFLVLRPDYSSTMSRALQRAVGTAAGAVLAAVISQFAHPAWTLAVAAGIAVAIAYGVFERNYLVFSVVLTVFVVLLLGILGMAAGPAATARVNDTAIGSVLALAAYLLWPTWHSRTAREKFAHLIEAHGRYTAALLRALAHPGGSTAAELDSLQAAARQARLDAEASAARLASEPEQSPLPPAVAQDLVTAVRRLAHAELSLHAFVSSARDTTGTAGAKRPAAQAAALGATMIPTAAQIRSVRSPHGGADDDMSRVIERLSDVAGALEDIVAPPWPVPEPASSGPAVTTFRSEEKEHRAERTGAFTRGAAG